MFVLSTDDGSAIRSASKVTVYHAFGDGDIRWRGKLYSVSGKQELSVSDMPVVPVKPSAPAGSGASERKNRRCSCLPMLQSRTGSMATLRMSMKTA